MSFAPCTLFLLEAVRAQPRGEELTRLATAGLDWERLIREGSRSGLLPLLWAGVGGIRTGAIPTTASDTLRRAFYANTARTLRFTAELLQLIETFSRAGIPVIPFKGPALAWSVYPTPGLRDMSDLDLLVRREDLPAARQLLFESGYGIAPHSIPSRFLDWNEEFPVHHRQSGIQVDLHWNPLPRHLGVSPDYFWTDLGSVTISGRQVPSFSPEKNFLYLCLHASKHGWNSLKWLCDLVRIADTFPLDWARIVEDAARFRLRRPVLLGIRLARDLLGLPCPGDLPLHLVPPQSYASALRHATVGWAQHSRLRELMFGLPLAESLGQKFALLRAMIEPTPPDLAAVALPASCSAAYYPVRAARLLAGAASSCIGALRPVPATHRQTPSDSAPSASQS